MRDTVAPRAPHSRGRPGVVTDGPRRSGRRRRDRSGECSAAALSRRGVANLCQGHVWPLAMVPPHTHTSCSPPSLPSAVRNGDAVSRPQQHGTRGAGGEGTPHVQRWGSKERFVAESPIRSHSNTGMTHTYTHTHMHTWVSGALSRGKITERTTVAVRETLS